MVSETTHRAGWQSDGPCDGAVGHAQGQAILQPELGMGPSTPSSQWVLQQGE